MWSRHMDHWFVLCGVHVSAIDTEGASRAPSVRSKNSEDKTRGERGRCCCARDCGAFCPFSNIYHACPREDFPFALHSPLFHSSLDILPQPPQPLLRLLQDFIRLADRKPQPVLDRVRVGVREELRRRDGRDAELLDAEPGQLEVARPAGDVRRERVVGGELHFGQVDKDEVAAFGDGVLLFQTWLVWGLGDGRDG